MSGAVHLTQEVEASSAYVIGDVAERRLYPSASVSVGVFVYCAGRQAKWRENANLLHHDTGNTKTGYKYCTLAKIVIQDIFFTKFGST